MNSMTRKSDHVDTYHGTRVPDPYRWLEDDTSAETAAWVAAQNSVTIPYLERIPLRGELQARVLQLNDYEKYSLPMRKGRHFFFGRNTGLQNQNVLFIQEGLDGVPEVLLDPNTWSIDGTVGLSVFVPSKDAKYAVYGISHSGSDWQQYKVMDLASRTTLDDAIEWVKVSGVAWHGDGFFYSRYPAPPPGSGEGVNQREPPGVLPPARHVAVRRSAGVRGPRQSAAFSHGSDDRGRTLRDPHHLRARQRQGWQRHPRVRSLDGRAGLHAARRGHLGRFVRRRRQRRRQAAGADESRAHRIGASCSSIPASPEEANWEDVLPERSEPLQAAGTAGGKLFATYLKDVTTRAYVYGLDGTFEDEVVLPGPGAASGFGGLRDDTFVFYIVQLAQCAADHLQVRHRDTDECRVPAVERAGLRPRGV